MYQIPRFPDCFSDVHELYAWAITCTGECGECYSFLLHLRDGGWTGEAVGPGYAATHLKSTRTSLEEEVESWHDLHFAISDAVEIANAPYLEPIRILDEVRATVEAAIHCLAQRMCWSLAWVTDLPEEDDQWQSEERRDELRKRCGEVLSSLPNLSRALINELEVRAQIEEARTVRWLHEQQALLASLRLGTGDKADSESVRLMPMPTTPDVRDLCERLQRGLPKGKAAIQIAREFTDHDEPKAQNLLRQARRYRHLWDPSQVADT